MRAALLFLALSAGPTAQAEDAPTATQELPLPTRPLRRQYFQLEPPGRRRNILLGAGIAGLAAGTAWYFSLGDTLGAGDPASLIMGAGFIGALGAGVGGLVSSRQVSEDGFEDRASTPPLAIALGSGGTAYLDEAIPLPLAVVVQPRLWFGDHVRLTAGGELFADLGPTIDVDWRPQGDYETALTQNKTGATIDSELRFYPGKERVVDFAWRPIIAFRWDTYTYEDGSDRRVQRMAIAPVTAGIRWHISGRQRFETFVGPRWDAIAWSGGGGRVEDATAYLGPLFLDSHYTLDFEHRRQWFGWQTRSRLDLGYLQSNFDGTGVNLGAAVGFMGPFYVGYDVRLRRNLDAWGLQLGLKARFAASTGIALQLGLLPPARRTP